MNVTYIHIDSNGDHNLILKIIISILALMSETGGSTGSVTYISLLNVGKVRSS